MSLLMIMVCSVFIAVLAGIYRLFKGPTVTDRVIALDLLFAVAIIFCLLAAWASARMVYLDVAIGLSLTGFISTLAWSRLVQLQNGQDKEDIS